MLKVRKLEAAHPGGPRCPEFAPEIIWKRYFEGKSKALISIQLHLFVKIARHFPRKSQIGDVVITIRATMPDAQDEPAGGVANMPDHV